MANKQVGIVLGLGAIVGGLALLLWPREKSVPPPPPPPGAANLYGQVTDASTNQPISGVQVSLGSAQAGTGTDGQYLFDNITPGAYTVSFIKQGYQSQSIGVILQEGNNQLNVQMTAVALEGQYYGNVTDAGGAPLSGVSIMINVLDRATWTTSTNGAGNYSFTNITPGDWATIGFAKAGYLTFEESIFLQSGNTEINIQMVEIVPAPNPIFQGGDSVQIVSLLGALSGCEQVAVPPGTISPYLSTALIGTIWRVNYQLNYSGPRAYYLLSRDFYLLFILDAGIIPAPAGSVQGYAAGKMVNPDTCQW